MSSASVEPTKKLKWMRKLEASIKAEERAQFQLNKDLKPKKEKKKEEKTSSPVPSDR